MSGWYLQKILKKKNQDEIKMRIMKKEVDMYFICTM